MAVHTHKITKTGRSNIERLPDNTGSLISYVGVGELEIEVEQRRNDEPTLSGFGESTTVGGKSGILMEASAESRFDLKLDSALVWATRYRLAVDGTSV